MLRLTITEVIAEYKWYFCESERRWSIGNMSAAVRSSAALISRDWSSAPVVETCGRAAVVLQLVSTALVRTARRLQKITGSWGDLPRNITLQLLTDTEVEVHWAEPETRFDYSVPR